jgi:hypothetical protein
LRIEHCGVHVAMVVDFRGKEVGQQTHIDRHIIEWSYANFVHVLDSHYTCSNR